MQSLSLSLRTLQLLCLVPMITSSPTSPLPSFPNIDPVDFPVAHRAVTCPSFWTDIIADLAPLFRENGGCTDWARASIRYAFHDAAAFSETLPFYAPAAGGADGSLLLSPDEITRPENAGLGTYHANLTQKYNYFLSLSYPVSAADLIQVAGALGVTACPGGRPGTVRVGRTDTKTSAPEHLLPKAFGAGSDHDTIYRLFLDKGISARDLAALLGAHSTSKASAQAANGIPVGTPQDTTPQVWDIEYYNQTLHPVDGMAPFESDVNLSKDVNSAVGRQFASMVDAPGPWAASFQSAFAKLSLLGVPNARHLSMAECTSVVLNAPFTS